MKFDTPAVATAGEPFDPRSGSIVERALFNHRVLVIVLCLLATVVLGWQATKLHELVQAVAAESGAGLGKVAQPIRVAVSGGSVSPPIDVTLEILGRDTTLQRLDRAIAACVV